MNGQPESRSARIEPTSGPQNGDSTSLVSHSGEIGIASLGGSAPRLELIEPRTPCSQGLRPEGGVTTPNQSQGFIRFQVRTGSAPRRPRLGPIPRTAATEWLVVRVVRSQRINGQPRLHLVRYLGAIRHDEITLLYARRKFWKTADERLAEFAQETRARFGRVIEARIPRPTNAEEAALRARLLTRAASKKNHP